MNGSDIFITLSITMDNDNRCELYGFFIKRDINILN